MLSYIIVGFGYRSEYYARVARTYPHLFRAMYLCRSAEKAALMRQRTGLEAAVTPEECLAFRPDFAVTAVDRGHMAELAPDTVQDEFAIASFLLDMGEWPKGGPSPYPLEEALEDAWFWLLLNRATANPWQEISSEPKPWK